MDKAWFQSRYDKIGPGGAGEQGEGADYINCPFENPNYLEFHAALLAADKTEFKAWEKNTPSFEGCLRIVAMDECGPRWAARRVGTGGVSTCQYWLARDK